MKPQSRISGRAAIVATLLGLELLTSLPARSQDVAPDEAAARLAGDTSRDWLQGDVTVWMGTDQSCKPGAAIYTFAKNRTARLVDCVNGKRVDKKATWEIKATEDPLDLMIVVDGATYKLLIFTKDGRDHLILRVPAVSKINPIIDREFVLSKD